MKNFIAVLIFSMLLAFSAKAQQSFEHFLVHKEFPNEQNNDTVMHLIVAKDGQDKLLDYAIKHFGPPMEKDKIGEYMWRGKSINGLGSNLVIVITDGVFVNSPNDYPYEQVFQNQSQKDDMLMRISENEEMIRMTRIKIKDANGNYIIHTYNDLQKVVNVLDKAFN